MVSLVAFVERMSQSNGLVLFELLYQHSDLRLDVARPNCVGLFRLRSRDHRDVVLVASSEKRMLDE